MELDKYDPLYYADEVYPFEDDMPLLQDNKLPHLEHFSSEGFDFYV